jgi:hypothetical protein
MIFDDIETLVAKLGPTDNPDELGRLDKIIRDLTAIKRVSLDELGGPVTGSSYQVTEQRSAQRSYNTAALYAAFAHAGWDWNDLRTAGAVRQTWQWTNLKRAAVQANVTISVTHQEVEDLGEIDGPQIGEVWKSSYRIEGVK